jgi:hypothetical protein
MEILVSQVTKELGVKMDKMGNLVFLQLLFIIKKILNLGFDGKKGEDG